MGIPADRLIRIIKPSPGDVYQTMREHYLIFMEQWNMLLTDQEKADYLGARIGKYPGMDVVGSFQYLESLPEHPTPQQIAELANQVLAGSLAWSKEDSALCEGLRMGVYAEYLVEMLKSR